ncbi:MAG: hypothetical protein R2712_26995 [Vicinamibacterales bacterium]
MAGDTLGLVDDEHEGDVMLVPVMRNGRRVFADTLGDARRRARASLATLPDALRRLDVPSPYAVAISPTIRALADEVDQRT